MFQNTVNRVNALGVEGAIARENPITSIPMLAEGVVYAGRFGFTGTNPELQVLGVKAGATAADIEGLIVPQGYQINFAGFNNGMQINDGAEVRVVKKGYVFVRPQTDSAKGDLVLVDVLTGNIRTGAAAIPASSAVLTYPNVVTTIGTWTDITAGTFDLTIDGFDVSLTGLDFSSAEDMDDVANVINTALDSDATCTYEAVTGLKITSNISGNDSVVLPVSASADMLEALGASTSVAGTNAFIDTGWKIETGNTAGQVAEAYNI